MNRVLIAALALAATVAGSPASAHDHDRHDGDCGYVTVDTDMSGDAGAATEWVGEVDILARSTSAEPDDTPTVEPITVECELFVNWESRGIVAAASGTGVVAHVAELRFTAAPEDVVEMCAWVTVSGYRYANCGYDPGPWNPFEPLYPTLTTLIDLVERHVIDHVDPTLCPALVLLAGQHGPVFVDAEGDVYLFGDTYDYLWWDCPPYEYGP